MLEGCAPWPEDFADRYREAGYWQGRPLGSLLQETCDLNADRVAVVCDDQSLTYSELGDASSLLARRLLNLGVKPLDRVVVQLPNVLDFPVVVFALFRIGAIPVMALPGHRKEEIKHLAGHSGA